MARTYPASPKLWRASQTSLEASKDRSHIDQTAGLEDGLETLSQNIETEASGLVEHLGDDLPDAHGYTSADDQEKAEQQLLAESARLVTTGPAKRKGQLKRTNHLESTVGFQRRMRKTTKARPDQYDLEASPQKPRHAPSGMLNGPPQLSPLKRQRKAQQAAHVQKRSRTATPADIANVPQLAPSASLEPDELIAPRRWPRKPKRTERGRSPQVVVERIHCDAQSLRRDPTADQADDARRMKSDDVELAPSHTGVVQPSARATEQSSSEDKPQERSPQQKSRTFGFAEASQPSESTHEGEEVEFQADDQVFVSQAGPEEDDDDEPGDGYEDDGNDQRLLAQWRALNVVFRNVKKVGRSIQGGEEQEPANFGLKDDDVIVIKGLCSKARETLERLRDEPGSEQELSDPPEELEEIKLRIQSLCGRNDAFPTDLIYSNLIPRILIKLLRTMVQCYYSIDKDKDDADPASDLTEAHLVTVTRFIGLILAVAAGAEASTVRLNAKLAVVRVVKSGLIIPLRRIKAVFTEHLVECERARQAREQQIEEELEKALEERRQDQEKRGKAEVAKMRKKWMSLHDHRRKVERGLLSREKQRHLRCPTTDAEREYDSTGRAFERQSVFRSRVGPLPAAAKRARGVVWPAKAIEALQLGLRRYAGPRVYEEIFSEYCCDKRGVLNGYNVTEIVVTAAMIKTYLEKMDTEEVGYVRDWVRAIPVWPRVYSYTDEEDGFDDQAVENAADEEG